MSRLVWSIGAIEDLQAIPEEVSRHSVVYADLVLARLVSGPERLVQFPELGRMVPEFALPNLRELIIRPYRVDYRLQGDVVEIVTVFHSARLLPGLHS